MKLRTSTPWLAGVLAVASVASSSPAMADQRSAHDTGTAVVSPEVVRTHTGPTGYEVTFRIHDPDATRMRIKGEWSFSSATDIAAAPLNPNPRLPSEWQIGDFPLQSPNGPNAFWPVFDMVKDANGVWSLTMPLPSGVFSYQFYADCDAVAPALVGCTPVTDPSNPPWNTRGSIERFSQVYLPSDSRFGSDDLSWQADVVPSKRGTLQSVSYPSPLSTNPVGRHDLAVYLPPGYDPDRETPYPLFVLSHGGGEHEIDWSTQGRLGQVVDNLIASHGIQPMVIAMTNFQNLANAEPGYASDVIDAVIPFMEATFNVSTDASGRAVAGTSGGGTRANQILFNNTSEFGYYGIWSAPRGLPAEGDPVYANPDLKNLLGVQLAIGIQDVGGLAGQNMANEQSRLAGAGVPFELFKADGGHTWEFWRRTLRDFLTEVAFRTTTTSVQATPTPAGVVLRAVVDPATDQPATPTGKVQFLVNGQPYGSARPLHNGEATLTIPATHLPPGSVTYGADYAGDRYYQPSSTTS